MTATATQPKLNSSQVLILQTLAKYESLTKSQLAQKSGATLSIDNLGPISKPESSEYSDSLYALGMIRPMQHEGEQEVTWSITAKGKKAADKFKTRKRSKGLKVPPEVLDPVVIKFRSTRTYGLELYTDDDIQEIRTLLGKDYSELDVDSLRQQIVTRRKVGAFSDPKAKLKASVEKAIREFGPEGLVASILTKTQVAQMKELLK